MTHISDLDMAKKIAEKVKALGGDSYFVGGYVRDGLRGISNKDIDFEVHGISPKELREILDSLGQRMELGESFGIFGLKGYTLDIAMPRKEEKRGLGHRNFDVIVDPNCGTFSASIRRDFTINAIMKNVLTGEIIDHFGGQDDLKKGIIRHVNSESFIEDPLRVLRACQFAARFDFTLSDETVLLCKTMDLKELSRERIMGELKKALLKADKPSIFFKVLREMNQLGYWFKELEDLIGVPQNEKFHKEGDAWTHTLMVLDEAVKFREQAENPLGFMIAAITHDFGKAVTTEFTKGAYHAYGHEIEGLPLVESFMKRLTNEKQLISYVLNLTEYHMKPNLVAKVGSSVKSTNKMYDACQDPAGLIAIGMADGLGKIPKEDCEYNRRFLEERLEIYREYMSRPFVSGKDLIEAGIRPDEHFKEYLAFAHKLRLAGIEKESALKQTLAMARKNMK